ncbi:hypothetical protein niasHT_010550 [Heterodera trifolii]|uniref:Uncharacterized protein n=1 Tax=Heterodera trifolii TaxID=157864 RepID=A0ABD2L2G3_9BILA
MNILLKNFVLLISFLALFCDCMDKKVLLCAELSPKELKKMDAKIDQIKHEITETIGRENEGKETVDDKVIKQLEDIANAKIAIETLSSFAINMTAQDYANSMLFEKKLKIPVMQQGHNAKKEMNKLQILKKELNDKIEKAKKLWKKNGKGGDISQSQTEIIEMKMKLELMDLMKESNLLMTQQYEKLAKECAKFGETEKNEWGKKLVEMFLKSLKEKMDKLREKLNENDWMRIDKLEKSLNKTIKGEKPHEEAAKSNSEELSKELRSTSEEASKAMEKHLKMDWKKIGIYSKEEMSNWRLAMYGYWALINFHKIGIVSNAKKIIELLTPKRKKKGQQQQQHQESNNNDKEKYQKWLGENAKLYKTVYARLFPQNDDDAKKGRRRRKRGFGEGSETSGCSRSRVDWSAWLQCISLILLIIIFIWLIIAALIAICSCIFAADNGGRRGGGDIFIFNNSSRSSSSSRDCSDCCCCFGTSSSSSSRGYSYGRPALTYFDSCSVVWWDLWN